MRFCASRERWWGRKYEPSARNEKMYETRKRALTSNLLEEPTDVVVLEWQTTTEHDIQNDPAAPDVNLGSRIERTSDDFRCSIVWTATAGLHEVAVLDLVRQAKVSNLHVEVVVEQNVFGFEITVDDLETMAAVDAGDHLLEESASLGLWHLALLDDVLEELAARVFEHDDDVRWC